MGFWNVSYFTFLFCTISCEIGAQIDIYPKHFGQVLWSRQILNPAFASLGNSTQITLSNKFHTGAFGKIYNVFAIGNFCLNKKDSARAFNSLGFKFVNEREGEFVERPRYGLFYSMHTLLSRDYRVGVTGGLGRASYIFKSTDVSTAGSGSNWDGDVAFMLYNPQNLLSLSMNQIFNSTIQPKNLRFRWRRFYSGYAERKVMFSNYHLKIYAQYQFLTDQRDVFDLGFSINVERHILLGANYWLGRSISFIAGIQELSIDQHHFNVYLSYNAPSTDKSSIPIQSFEISLFYKVK